MLSFWCVLRAGGSACVEVPSERACACACANADSQMRPLGQADSRPRLMPRRATPPGIACRRR